MTTAQTDWPDTLATSQAQLQELLKRLLTPDSQLRPLLKQLLTPTSQPQLLVDETEAARILGLRPAFLKEDRRTRRMIPYLRLGDLIRYSVIELHELIAAWRAARDKCLREGRLPDTIGAYFPPEPVQSRPLKRGRRRKQLAAPETQVKRPS